MGDGAWMGCLPVRNPGLEEARRELQRISDFCQQEDPPELFDYLCRTFLFSLESSVILSSFFWERELLYD